MYLGQSKPDFAPGTNIKVLHKLEMIFGDSLSPLKSSKPVIRTTGLIGTLGSRLIIHIVKFPESHKPFFLMLKTLMYKPYWRS